MDPKTGNGNAWTFGYFEARISFDPSVGRQAGRGYPAFWAESANRIVNHKTDQFAELDIFEEEGTAGTGFQGTLHHWEHFPSIDYWNANSHPAATVNWLKWHVVAARWVPGQVTWYLDGKLLMAQAYSATAPPVPAAKTAGGTSPTPEGVFSPLDAEKLGMELIVGSGPGWPLQIDWVRVWH